LQKPLLMNDDARQAAREGAFFGVVAGVIFAACELAAARVSDAPLLPVRMSASLLLGPSAVGAGAFAPAVLLGVGIHLFLSATFGAMYGFFVELLDRERSWGYQAGLGMLYGLVLWALNFQVLARATHPWFLGAAQPLQAVLHACAFGLPLALMHVRLARNMRAALVV
jgi:hypothetical protein